MLLPQFYIDDIIKAAVKEDINYLDQATAFGRLSAVPSGTNTSNSGDDCI